MLSTTRERNVARDRRGRIGGMREDNDDDDEEEEEEEYLWEEAMEEAVDAWKAERRPSDVLRACRHVVFVCRIDDDDDDDDDDDELDARVGRQLREQYEALSHWVMPRRPSLCIVTAARDTGASHRRRALRLQPSWASDTAFCS
eukprot:ctg_4855.g671